MARSPSNRQFRESASSVDQSLHEGNRLLGPLPRGTRPVSHDWMSEFPQEPAPLQEPAIWVEVPHPHIAPPAHTEFRPFSPARWIRSHRSLARAGALAVALILTALLGLAAWMQREQDQTVITQSATSEPLLARPIVTPPPAPPIVFTSQAAPPAESATSLPPARAGGAARAEVKKPAPAPPRASAPRERSNTPPARVTAPPPARVTSPASGRATASSPSSRGFAPPLPPATPPARPPDVKAPPPPVTDKASSSTITTSRPPVDRAPLVLSSPAREPGSATPTPAPAPAPPPPPSPEARETAAVEVVLERYRLAFSTLNSGVSDFWPGVNSRALDKAFNELEQQRFEFDQCRVQLNGGQAEATCTGSATFVPKVGNKTPRTQSRQWSFSLVRVGNRWTIDSVQSR